MMQEKSDMTNGATCRQLPIKNLRVIRALSPRRYIEQNKSLNFEDGIHSIYTGTCTTYYEELYRFVDNLCTLNGATYIFEACNRAITTYLNNQAESELMTNEDEAGFLLQLSEIWLRFCQRTRLVSNICLVYDRKLLRISEDPFDNWMCSLTTISRMSVDLFRSQIVQHPFLEQRIVATTFKCIEMARLNDETVRYNVLNVIVSMFIKLELYQEIFQIKFIDVTMAFYKEQSELHINNMNLVDYVNYTNNQLDDESRRITAFNLTNSAVMIHCIMTNELVTLKVQEILKREGQLFALYDSKDIETLRILYKLMKLIPDPDSAAMKALSCQFGKYIVTRGSEIVKIKSVTKQMVEKTLLFKLKIDEIVANCFENSPYFLDIIRVNFKTVLNGNSFAKHLAQFVDVHLRSRNLDQVDKTLDSIMVLFRYLLSKDVFQAFYYRHFAKRLLIGKSSSQDAEKSMISKLRLECGEGFTSKLEGMLKDMELSESINSAFKTNFKKSGRRVDLNVFVLTDSFWPNFSNPTVVLGDEFQQFQEIFNEYYSKQYRKRKLLWQPSLGTCILTAHFDKVNTKELQLSIIQSAILLRFNTCPEYIVQDLSTLVNLPPKDFTRNMTGLIKSNVLLLSSKLDDEEMTFNPEDTIKLNQEFSDKMFRIKIYQGPALKDTQEEEQAIERRVTHERQFNVDAAIVRIMKQKRRLSHNGLVAELFKLVDVPSTATDFKKRIELLIERDYIQRDKDNSEIYNYVA